jgi:hypothetical protein
MWRALSPRAHAHHLKSKKKLSHETPAPSQTLNLSTRHARKKRITCNSTGGSASGKEGLHGEGGGSNSISLARGQGRWGCNAHGDLDRLGNCGFDREEEEVRKSRL